MSSPMLYWIAIGTLAAIPIAGLVAVLIVAKR